jgi:hypothetical protein
MKATPVLAGSCVAAATFFVGINIIQLIAAMSDPRQAISHK